MFYRKIVFFMQHFQDIERARYHQCGRPLTCYVFATATISFPQYDRDFSSQYKLTPSMHFTKWQFCNTKSLDVMQIPIFSTCTSTVWRHLVLHWWDIKKKIYSSLNRTHQITKLHSTRVSLTRLPSSGDDLINECFSQYYYYSINIPI